MIKIKVRFFALVADLIGKSSIELLFNKKKITLREVLNHISKLYPQLYKINKGFKILILVNGEQAPLNKVISDGDEIAFIPPVAGGGD